MIAALKRENVLAGALGGAMILAVLALFFATHYQALLHAGASSQTAVAPSANLDGLNIPTIDQMCKTAGATADNMASCKDQENQAAEFVIAWMGLNGFLTNGAIDMSQIELASELGADAASPLTNPHPGLDSPDGLDPGAAGDPSAGLDGGGGLDAGLGDPGADPATGEPDQMFDTPAALAMYCLTNSMDWMQMHDCISHYDPSTQFNGGI